MRPSGNGGEGVRVPSVPFFRAGLRNQGRREVRALTGGNPGGAARGLGSAAAGARAADPARALRPRPTLRPRAPAPPGPAGTARPLATLPAAVAAAAAPVARRPPEQGKLGPSGDGRLRARLGAWWGKWRLDGGAGRGKLGAGRAPVLLLSPHGRLAPIPGAPGAA